MSNVESVVYRGGFKVRAIGPRLSCIDIARRSFHQAVEQFVVVTALALRPVVLAEWGEGITQCPSTIADADATVRYLTRLQDERR